MSVFSTRAMGGGWPSWSTGTPRRMASIWPLPGMNTARASTGALLACGAGTRSLSAAASPRPSSQPRKNSNAPSSSARGMASNSLRLSMVRLLGGEDPYRALLVVGLLGNRIGRVQGDLVDQLAGIEPGHEHHPTWHAVAAAGLHPGTHLPAARLHPDLVAALEPARPRVVRVHEADRRRERAVQLGDAHGHRAGMPVLQHPPGDEPQAVLGVRRLGRRLVGQRPDRRLAVLVAVELEPGSGLHVGVGALAVAPAGFLAGHHRPAQPARPVVVV